MTVKFTNVEHSFLVLLEQKGIHCTYILLYICPYIGTDAIDTSLCKPPPSITHEPPLLKRYCTVICNGTYTHYRYFFGELLICCNDEQLNQTNWYHEALWI